MGFVVCLQLQQVHAKHTSSLTGKHYLIKLDRCDTSVSWMQLQYSQLTNFISLQCIQAKECQIFCLAGYIHASLFLSTPALYHLFIIDRHAQFKCTSINIQHFKIQLLLGSSILCCQLFWTTFIIMQLSFVFILLLNYNIAVNAVLFLQCLTPKKTRCMHVVQCSYIVARSFSDSLTTLLFQCSYTKLKNAPVL